MQTSEQGRKEIAGEEGIVLRAYPDPATGGSPWTVGVGHTSAAGPPSVHRSTVLSSEQEALDILAADLHPVDDLIDKLVIVPLKQHQHDALASLTFNIGGGNFGRSTLLRRLNDGDYQGAADQFLVWDRAAGRVLAGLQRRRARERELFLTGRYSLVGAGTPPAQASVDAGVVLVRGSREPEAVRALQQDLRALGLTEVVADGDFGPHTEVAVRKAQASLGVTIDGRVGPATRAAIAAALAARGLHPEASHLPTPGQPIEAPPPS